MITDELFRVESILEDDFGCEERPEGEKKMVLVRLKNYSGEEKTVRQEDDWLTFANIQEGDPVTLDGKRLRKVDCCS